MSISIKSNTSTESAINTNGADTVVIDVSKIKFNLPIVDSNNVPYVNNASASTTVKGIVELATTTETNSTDSVRAVTPAGFKATLGADTGASLVGFKQTGTGAVARTLQDKGRETVSVTDFSTVQLAVDAALAAGAVLDWPAGTYVVTTNIANFHSVQHTGAGIIQRGSDQWAITPSRTTVRKMYVAPSGLTTNDGLDAANPQTIQGAINALHFGGPIVGRQQIIGIAGTYNESVKIPVGLSINDNYLEFKFPSTPGVQGVPSTWAGAILDGTTNDAGSAHGFEIGAYNRVYIEYLLIRDWYNTSLGATSQVKRGLHVNEYAYLYTYGVSAFGNGLSNISCDPNGQAIVTGGILDGARYGVDNTGGRMSFSASVSTFTTIKNGLEYGIHAKHNSSTVLDYTVFEDCGQVGGASAYGSAIFAYKTGTSIDTRACVFRRNNIVYNARGGYISTLPASPDTFGTGGDVNDRIWLVRGYGSDDLINYTTKAGRELSQSNGGNSTTSVTTVRIYDTNAQIPAQYLTQADAHLEIEIFCSNAAGGTAQIRPSLEGVVSGTRYELANFQLAASAFAHIRMIVQPVAGGATASLWWATQGATIGGATSGFTGSVAIPFNTDNLEFQVWGEAAAGTVTVRKTRVVLWG